MSDASKRQEGGNHYAQLPEHAQPWNVLKHWLTPEEYRGWQKGNAIVYLARERQKGGDTDISKAKHHLERLIEEFSQEFPDLPGGHPQPVYEDVPRPAKVLASDLRVACDAAKVAGPDATLQYRTVPLDGGGEWIEWESGPCPIPLSAEVEAKVPAGYRSGPAGSFRWSYAWDNLGSLAQCDVRAYRLVKEEPQWPMVSEPGDHSKIKAAYKPGMEWKVGGIDTVDQDIWEVTRDEPGWLTECCYAIRPAQGAQA
jgi:hypothetical protein